MNNPNLLKDDGVAATGVGVKFPETQLLICNTIIRRFYSDPSVHCTQKENAGRLLSGVFNPETGQWLLVYDMGQTEARYFQLTA